MAAAPAPTLTFALSLALFVGVGCEAPEPVLEDASSTLGRRGEAVSLLGAGPYRRIRGCSGHCISTYYFWADLAVRNDAFHKSVGVRYSVDGWRTSRIAHATYEGPLEDGWERWGLDVELGTAMDRPHREIQIAAFAEMNGTTHWDPDNHYYIYESVSRAAPVRLLSSAVRFVPGQGGLLSGRVRVFDLAYDKQVSVHYTADGWASSAEIDAYWVEGDDWAFEAPGLLDAQGRLPDEVRFAVRYEALGEAYWDNHAGRDFAHRLHPRFDVVTDDPLDAVWSGIVRPGATPRSDIAVAQTEVRVDGGAWQPGDRVVLSTWALGDGPHTVEVRATLEGGYTAIERIDFAASNRIAPRDTWRPLPDVMVAGRTDAAWHVEVDGQGRWLVLWDSGRIGRYASVGDPNAPFLFDPPPVPGRLSSFAVDAQDRVYAVGGDRTLLRWRADGALDPSFGAAGRVSLMGTVGGRRLCYAGRLVAGPAALYLTDTCNRRVLRFDLQGNFTSELEVGVPGRSGVPVHAVHDGSALWVAAQGDLVRVVDVSGGQMEIADRVPLSAPLAVSGIALEPSGGFWITTSDNTLAAVSALGQVRAQWRGGPQDAPFAGAFSLGRSPVVLGDGTVAVLGVEGAKVVRFDRALLP